MNEGQLGTLGISDELESACEEYDYCSDDPGDTRDDIDEALVSEAFRTGAGLGDDVD